jgi:hypothetical protein
VIEKVAHPTQDVMLLKIEPLESAHLNCPYADFEPDMTTAQIVIAGFGRRNDGRTGGDSGAALFAVSADANCRLVGIVTGGSLSCDGHDVAIRIAQLTAWLADQIARLDC